MTVRPLEWVSVGGDADAWRERLGSELDRRFGTRSVAGEACSIRDEWMDRERGQLCADAVLDALIDRHDAEDEPDGARWLLGITEADLYGADRPYVFGEATIGGCCALVSLARLEANSSEFEARVRATITHELAHVAGLEHCEDPYCVMWASCDVLDTDRKGTELCPSCTGGLERLSGSAPADSANEPQ